MEGRWSRNAYDVSMCLHWFGSMYRLWKNEEDLKAYAKVFQDLKYMQVADLRSQHLDYLVKGLSAGTQYLIEKEKTSESTYEILHSFIPKLLAAIDADLSRFQLRHVIYLISSFQKMYEQSLRILREYDASKSSDAHAGSQPMVILSEKKMREVHAMGARYLN